MDRSLAKARRVEALCRAHGFGGVRCLAADSRHLCAEDAGSWRAGGDARAVRGWEVRLRLRGRGESS